MRKRPLLAERLGEAPAGGGGGGPSLTLTQTGLLVVHIANDGTNPFVAGNWDNGDPTMGNASVDGTSGRLLLPTTSGPGWGGWSYSNGDAARTKRMTFAEMLSTNSAAYWGTVFGFADSATTRDYAGVRFSIDRSPENGSLVTINNNSASVPGSTESVTAKDDNVLYRFTAFVDGTSLEGYDFDADQAYGPETHAVISSGYGGLGANENAGGITWQCERYYEFRDKVLTVTAMPTGYKAKVRDSGDVVLAEATESGGSAIVTLDQVDPADIDHLQITTGADVEDLQEPDDVWAGTTFAYVAA